MKTLKSKVFSIAAIALLLLFSGVSDATFGWTPAVVTTDKLQYDNLNVHQDIMAIKLVRERIKQLESQYKKDKTAGLEEACVIDKKELMKAEADLQWNKNYLAADKKALVKDHKLAMKATRDEIKKDRTNLVTCRKRLDKHIEAGNESALAEDAGNVVYYKNELNRDRNKLTLQREQLNSDLVAINKEIQKVNGQFVVVTYSETAYANVSDWLIK